MLNAIWLGLLLGAMVLCGFQLAQDPSSGILGEVTLAAFAACETAVMKLALPLAGIMALWLGMMRLAEKAGLISILARFLRPVLTRLFPDVPANHPAMGSMLMNIAANMLGLANAATPLGLRAMQDLEKLNPRPGVATNAMCTFLAINTSSVQLIPATAVAFMAAAGSTQPTAIIGTAFIATLCSTIVGITAAKTLERLPGYRLPPLQGTDPKSTVSPKSETPATDSNSLSSPEGAASQNTLKSASSGTDPKNESEVSAMPAWATVVLIVFAGLFALMAFQIFGARLAADDAPVGAGRVLISGVEAISILAVPFLLTFFPLYAALRKIPVYEEFVEGAKEGLQVAFRIIPYLVAILVAIGMFRAAGGIKLLSEWLGPLLAKIGFPVELLPLAIMRPLSGSGANGIFNELITNPEIGPDSLIGRMAGSIMGSTETTFYVLAVYFGSVAIRRTRHAVPAGLLADLTGVTAAIIICRIVFG